MRVIVTSVLEVAAILLAVAGLYVLFGFGVGLVAAGLGLGVYAWRLS